MGRTVLCTESINSMRIMGIDYGDSRIGVSISDPMGWIAQAVETINLNGSTSKAVQRIYDLAKGYSAERIVVGFPKNMNGTIGPRGEKTLEFIELLDRKVNDEESRIEIIKWDERLTTVAANRTMHELGVKTSRKKNLVDQIAAVYILQGYLDSLKNL